MATRVISAILTLRDKNFSTNMKKAAAQMNDFSKKTAIVSSGIAGIASATGPAIAGVGAVASSFAAAGLGAAAFGAVAASSLKDVFEASEEVEKIEEKIAKADSAKERAAAQKELAAVYADMGTAQKGALKDLQDFKSFWGGFVKQFEQPVFTAFSEGLQFTQKLLKGLEPTITNVSGAVVGIMQDMNKSIDSSGMKGFFTWLETSAATSLTNFATIIGNTFSGVFNMLQAFAPLGASVEGGLVSMTEKFQQWSAGLSESKGFQNFIEYAKTNGPVLMDTLGNIGTIIGDVVTSLAPFGSILLDLFNQLTSKLTEITPYLDLVVGKVTEFATVIVDNWGTITSIITPIAGAIGALYIQLKLLSIFNTIKGFMDLFKASTIATTFATQGFNAALRANPIGLVVTLITLLIGVGVALYQNWDVVKAKASELWSKVTEVFGGIYDWAVQKIQPVIGFFKGLYDKFIDFKNAIMSFKPPEWVSKIGGAISGAASKVGGWISGSHATGLNSVPYDGYIAELHKGEMVIPARQSERIRVAGGSIDNVDQMVQPTSVAVATPTPAGSTSQLAPTSGTAQSTPSNNGGVQVIIQNLNAKGVTAKEVVDEFVPMLKLRLANM
ncbi:hypothetical protein [Lysinibacillus xylanilyticus]|uniref:hypothetical protein n=1 Tax=Lysinibacillus xylanilyticus TaxID=582475 RepID=UPI003D079F94